MNKTSSLKLNANNGKHDTRGYVAGTKLGHNKYDLEKYWSHMTCHVIVLGFEYHRSIRLAWFR